MHVFSQNNYKIENGGKKTFAIIPKSAKSANVSSVNDSQFTVCIKIPSGGFDFVYVCLLVPAAATAS